MDMTESREQILLVNWMRKNYPEHRILAIPNGGARGAATAQKLKMEGVSAGVPDLMIPSLHLFIEMKRVKGGTVSPEQKDWLQYLNNCGYTAIVCNGFEEAKRAIQSAITSE